MKKPWLVLAVPGLLAAGVCLVPHPVKSEAVGRFPIRATCSGPGTLEALLSANLGTKVSTRLAEMRVDVGDLVRAGQTLMLLDHGELDAQLSEAVAAREAADHQVRAAKEALARAEALQGRSGRDLQRHEALQAEGLPIVSEADLDGLRTQARTSAQDTAQARALLAQAVSALSQASANVLAARSRLGDATIRAPFDGQITARWKSPGDVLPPGTAILSLVHLPSLVVVARFDESLIGRLQPGMKARIRFDGSPDRPSAGLVTRINRAMDPDTREFTVNISLEALPAAWAMGERATVDLPDQRVPAAQTVPAGFLAEHRGRKGLWVLKGSRAEFLAVVFGSRDAERLEVLTKLPDGTRILEPRGLWSGRWVKAL